MLLSDIREMPKDNRLLSRPELSKKYQVSRTTIDKAISELIGEGYLYAKDGSGTYVAEIANSSRLTEVADYFASWGVILPDIRSDTYPGILRGIEDIANANEINIIICNSDNDEDKQNDYLRKLICSRVSGVIMVPAVFSSNRTDIFNQLEAAGIPLVFCNRTVNDVEAPRVVSNNFYGAYVATRHLISNGFRKIAYITRSWYSTAMERFQGYTSALEESGIRLGESYYTFPADQNGIVDEVNAIRTLIGGKSFFDAVLCFNDSIAKNIYWELVNAGYQPGAGFGLVGYDNTHICEQLPVKLTSVRFKTYEIGSEAAKLMLRMMRGEMIHKSKAIVLQPTLEIRESSLKNNAVRTL